MPIPLADLALPPLFTAADLRGIERRWAAQHPGRSLMDAAGTAAAELAARLALDTGAPVLVLAGPGNNGGDALVAARVLAGRGHAVVVASRADPDRLPPDAAAAWAAWQAAGGGVPRELPVSMDFSLVVDGLYGAGLVRDVAGEDARWIAAVNALPCPRLALDLPSGLDGDTGAIRGCAVRADHTLSFLGLKPGLFTADGPDCAGQVWLDALGTETVQAVVAGALLNALEARHRLPPRPKNSHKGDFGRVGIVGAAA
ncbi:MAG: NAD(P)H-hydrate epimerase, partial [Pseudomonadota bacterium]